MAYGDTPACNICGNITEIVGEKYKCLNCGNDMGEVPRALLTSAAKAVVVAPPSELIASVEETWRPPESPDVQPEYSDTQPFEDFDVVLPTGTSVIESPTYLPANGHGSIDPAKLDENDILVDHIWYNNGWLVIFEGIKGIYFARDFKFVKKSGRPPRPMEEPPKPMPIVIPSKKIAMPTYDGPPRIGKTAKQYQGDADTPAGRVRRINDSVQLERDEVWDAADDIAQELQNKKHCRSWADLYRILDKARRRTEQRMSRRQER